ncbi:hypothetical protein D3C76_1499100 [compost metagenome]
MKQLLMSQDISSTDHLTRMDAKKHLTTMVNQFNKLDQKQRKQYIQELQKKHQHIKKLIWVDFNSQRSTPYQTSDFTSDMNNNKMYNTYQKIAKNQLRYQRAYESPAFRVDETQYFIMAEPSSQDSKGIIALISQQVLT